MKYIELPGNDIIVCLDGLIVIGKKKILNKVGEINKNGTDRYIDARGGVFYPEIILKWRSDIKNKQRILFETAKERDEVYDFIKKKLGVKNEKA